MNNYQMELIEKLYSENDTAKYESRISELIKKYKAAFSSDNFILFSTPGRAEISGNHTDHNHGKVLAASINLDSLAAAAPNQTNEIVIYSSGFNDAFVVNLNGLDPDDKEKFTTNSLIRGVAAGFKNRGYNIGGFNACLTSDVLIGSGLSSSASIEVLFGSIFNCLYNDGIVSAEEIAMIGQYAENIFFGKPCGLMDQVACASGGMVAIDFYIPGKPLIKKIDFDFNSTGYKLLVVDTEENHSDLTDDYASIPREMKQVAACFGKQYCSEITLGELLGEMKHLRKKVSDRALLRAIHFLEENERVDRQVEALSRNNFNEFLELVNESGNSSYKYLQNIYSAGNVKEQGVSLGLALSEMFIKKNGKGACRVHGGGFAGTIQLFLPEELVESYTRYITQLFRSGSVKVLSIRKYGSVCFDNI